MGTRGSGDADEYMHASWLLNAVEEWAGCLRGEYWLVRETVAAVVGRIDGLLIPASYDSPIFRHRKGSWIDKAGIIGVEVKASRGDFLRGLRENQFDRYNETLTALYVATPRSVKTSEVPAPCGHLVVYRPPGRRGWSCVCKRQPKYRDVPIDADTMWRLVFYAIKRMRTERHEERKRLRIALERIGSIAERRVIAMLEREAKAVTQGAPND